MLTPVSDLVLQVDGGRGLKAGLSQILSEQEEYGGWGLAQWHKGPPPDPAQCWVDGSGQQMT